MVTLQLLGDTFFVVVAPLLGKSLLYKVLYLYACVRFVCVFLLKQCVME